MNSTGIFGGVFPALEKALDLRSYKHNIITSNIANIDTPNYKGFDLIIGDELGKSKETKRLELRRTDSKHFSGTQVSHGINHRIVPLNPVNKRADGNNVDLDKMMSTLAENGLMYNASSQIYAKKLQSLKYVISGGNK